MPTSDESLNMLIGDVGGLKTGVAELKRDVEYYRKEQDDMEGKIEALRGVFGSHQLQYVQSQAVLGGELEEIRAQQGTITATLSRMESKMDESPAKKDKTAGIHGTIRSLFGKWTPASGVIYVVLLLVALYVIWGGSIAELIEAIKH